MYMYIHIVHSSNIIAHLYIVAFLICLRAVLVSRAIRIYHVHVIARAQENGGERAKYVHVWPARLYAMRVYMCVNMYAIAKA